MSANLRARAEGGTYRTTPRLRADGEIVLTRERSMWVATAVALSLSIAIVAVAWPRPDHSQPVLEPTSVAVRGADVCVLDGMGITCTFEDDVKCTELYEGRHLVGEDCKPTVRRWSWLQGADGVVAALGSFCGIHGRRIDCLDRDTHVVLEELPVQVVGTEHMLCARGESNRVSCYDRRRGRLPIEMRATRIASGPHHVCAATSEGVECWHRHGEPFLATHQTGHRNLGVASSHVCMRGEDAWCVSFDARDRRPWAMPSELALTSGLASRGDEVCALGADLVSLACSRSGDVPFLDLRGAIATELALTAERACVRTREGVHCRSIYSAGDWDPFQM